MGAMEHTAMPFAVGWVRIGLGPLPARYQTIHRPEVRARRGQRPETVILMLGHRARCGGAKNHSLALGDPAYCPTCDREMEKERNAADLNARGHWQRPPGADPRTDKPAPPEKHAGIIKPIGR
jgi:hypothetical protein